MLFCIFPFLSVFFSSSCVNVIALYSVTFSSSFSSFPTILNINVLFPCALYILCAGIILFIFISPLSCVSYAESGCSKPAFLLFTTKAIFLSDILYPCGACFSIK